MTNLNENSVPECVIHETLNYNVQLKKALKNKEKDTLNAANFY